MDRIKSVFCLASKAIASIVIVGLALGPETMKMGVGEAVPAVWRALGDHLANQELVAIAHQLDRQRLDAERIEAARDRLSARVRSIGAFRACVATLSEERDHALGADSERELASLDAAIAMLKSTSACADRALDAARKSIRRKESELIVLQAAVETCRANQVLQRTAGDPSLWYERVARTHEFLRMGHPKSNERFPSL
jgi:hypothetical protein